MKTILLSLLLICTITLNAQNDSTMYSYYPSNISVPEFDGKEYVPYVVGSHTIPGYELEIRVCSLDEAILSNGKRIAGLSCIITEEESYVGGDLIFDGDTTTIVSVKAVAKGSDGAEFVVTGKDFTMKFNLSDGHILKLENDYTTFNTEGVGVWTITKKS